MADRPHVAVVGGGIAGLATAWYLKRSGGVDVTLLEGGSRLGGKIRTEELGDTPVEGGPDTFLAQVPWAVDLCRELGLADDLVEPATGKAYIWARGGLRPLPHGQVLGVPTELSPLLRSGVVSSRGVARAALDLVLPRTRWLTADPSVAEVIRGRLGREVLESSVEPLLGGINAGRADELSLRAVAPQLADAARANRSLVLGLRRQRRRQTAQGPSGPTERGIQGPVFLGLRGGMERLVERLRDSLEGVDVRLGARVKAVERAVQGGYRLVTEGAADVHAPAIALAVPTFAAAGMLNGLSPAAAGALAHITYASVVVTTLGYRPEAVARELDGSGFLVPRREGWLTTACTWSTAKWPALEQTGLTILRASSGRLHDNRAMRLDDGALVERLHHELQPVLGLSEKPDASLVTRWHHAFPQYQPGHEARVEHIERALERDAPGVLVTGAAYRGLGIAACIRQARATADRLQRFSVRERGEI